MPRLSKAHDHARRRLLELAAAGLPVSRLTAQVAATLQHAIGWDGFRLFGLDPRTMLINRLLGASENDAEARLEWLREVYLALPTPYAELPELARTGLRTVAFQERQDQCWGFPPSQLSPIEPAAHYRHFHEFRSPVGGTLLAIFRDQDRPVAAMQAYRRDPKRAYRATEVAFLHQVSPIVGTALAAAMDRDSAVGRYAAAPATASGIVLVETGGGIRFATPAGERWLDALGERVGGLPTPVWATMAALRGTDAGAAAVTVPLPDCRVRIEASPGGEPGLAAIVISPEAPPPPPEVPASWGLTPQERAVVTELATGKSNARIAEALFVSEHTVEWHLRGIYDKLDVSSRQEVLTALFRQTLLPGIVCEVLRPAS
jgi:DNA-binding CsgD family transcriptional regulator